MPVEGRRSYFTLSYRGYRLPSSFEIRTEDHYWYGTYKHVVTARSIFRGPPYRQVRVTAPAAASRLRLARRAELGANPPVLVPSHGGMGLPGQQTSRSFALSTGACKDCDSAPPFPACSPIPATCPRACVAKDACAVRLSWCVGSDAGRSSAGEAAKK